MKDMSFEEYIEWDPQAKNGQTLQICGTHLPSEASVERAKEKLKDFKVVGITEMFNESLTLLAKEFGWSSVEYKKKISLNHVLNYRTFQKKSLRK
ncbi:hypothetical protein AAAC51_44670 [Priestia megaterium]